MQSGQELDSLLRLSIVLQGEIAKKFEAIKRKYGFESSADLFRLLVSEKYDDIFASSTSTRSQLQATLARP